MTQTFAMERHVPAIVTAAPDGKRQKSPTTANWKWALTRMRGVTPMTAEEIYDEIAYDIMRFRKVQQGLPTVVITEALLNFLIMPKFYKQQPGVKPEMFGCYVEVVKSDGFWWVVGYKQETQNLAKRGELYDT